MCVHTCACVCLCICFLSLVENILNIYVFSKEATEQLLAAELYARFLALITMMILVASWYVRMSHHFIQDCDKRLGLYTYIAARLQNSMFYSL